MPQMELYVKHVQQEPSLSWEVVNNVDMDTIPKQELIHVQNANPVVFQYYCFKVFIFADYSVSGTHSVANKTTCLPCPPGSYSGYETVQAYSDDCQLCKPGYISPKEGATTYQNCLAGISDYYFVDFIIHSFVPGTMAAPNRTICTPCQSGTYASTYCYGCEGGYYSEPGSSSCLL